MLLLLHVAWRMCQNLCATSLAGLVPCRVLVCATTACGLFVSPTSVQFARILAVRSTIFGVLITQRPRVLLQDLTGSAVLKVLTPHK